jgi:uncharacterized membrane protein YozB (DUF420 family)
MGEVELFGVLMSTEGFVSMVGSIVVACLLILAVVLGLRHKGVYHHHILLVAYLSDELILKVIMYSRLKLGVFGDFPYGGTMAPMHIFLATVVTVLGLATIVLGFRYRVKKNRGMFMPPKGMKWHKPIGFLYVAFWFAAFLDGIYIFRSLYP